MDANTKKAVHILTMLVYIALSAILVSQRENVDTVTIIGGILLSISILGLMPILKLDFGATCPAQVERY